MRQSCLLCQINNHYKNFEEDLRKIKDKKIELRKFAFELFELLEEYVRIDCLSLKAFSGEYSVWFQDNYTSQKSEVSLKDYLKYDDCLEKTISKEVLEKF